MIRTERLLLRKPQLDDDLAEFVADDAVQRWIGGPEDPAALIERWVGRWERNGVGPFLVELDGRLIGRVGFIVWDNRTWETSTYDLAGAHAETELGWAILSSHWANGYATEAARAAREWIERDRIISLIDPANVRSKRVAEKLGARPTERVTTPHAEADVWVHP
ncbi:MAG: GNAT family N-acetyltransferase [Acidobacteriota bacterium]|nr:GNAT family N-acetyltransferase [Acidobacteriota bacterium]